jgi:hypothetical protein
MGFQARGSRAFVRVVGDILQYLDLQLSAWGSKDFAVNYTSLPLFPPTDHIYLPCGGRVPRGHSSDGWWSAKSHEVADQSMTEVLGVVRDRVVPFFARTSLLADLRDELLPSSNAHHLFGAACCEARLGSAGALRTTASALAAFHRWHAEMPERTWCLERITLAERLAEALGSGGTQRLLDEWRLESLAKLRIEDEVAAQQ